MRTRTVSRGFPERIRLGTCRLLFSSLRRSTGLGAQSKERTDRRTDDRTDGWTEQRIDGKKEGKRWTYKYERGSRASISTINLVVSRVLAASTRSDRTFVPRIQDGKLARDRAGTHPRAPIAYFIFSQLFRYLASASLLESHRAAVPSHPIPTQ